MSRPRRNFLTLELTTLTSGPNASDPGVAPPPQTPFMNNNNKENMPPPRPRAPRVILMQPPPLPVIAPPRPSGQPAAHSRTVSRIGISNPSIGLVELARTLEKPASGARLWKLPRPAASSRLINRSTGLWGTDTRRVFVAPTIWEHPSSECLLFTAEQDEEMRDGGEALDANQLEIYDCGVEMGHRNLLFSRFARRC